MKKFFCILLTLCFIGMFTSCIQVNNADDKCDKCFDSGWKAWIMHFDEDGKIINSGGLELCLKCAHQKGWAMEFKEID